MKKINFIIMLFLLGITAAKSQIVVLEAANGTAGYSGDGGQATAAEIWQPSGVAMDASGNFYLSDTKNNRVRKITTSGVISTFAGNGTAGFSGDGGQATAAEVNTTHGMTIDGSGNLYFTDGSNNRVRKVNTSGVISTIAGNGTSGFSGDGGQATAAEIKSPSEVTMDGSNNIYISDYGNNRIRKINTSGVISTIAGNSTAGFSGDGGQATAAEFNAPADVYVDASNIIYINDRNNNRIRKINTSGVVSTIAGNGTAGFSGDGGQATAAELNSPTGVRTDASSNIYVADRSNNRMRKINGSGVISTVAGNGTAGYSGDGGQATSAEFNLPGMMVFDQSGNLYFVDNQNNRIRELYLTLNVTTSVITNVSCHGGSNGSASSTVSHGSTPYTYSWTGGGTSSTYTGLTAGTYTLTATDADGVTGTSSVTITQPATSLSVSATAKYASVCPGKTDSLKSTPSGGTSAYTYNWLPAPFGDMNCSTCQNTSVYPFGTTFTITATDHNGCTATASTSITINPYPYVTVVGKMNPIIPGGTDTLVASGGTSYVWNNAATTSSISVTPSVPTTYSVVATNSSGCRDSAQYVIDTDKIGTGLTSSTAIRIVPTTSLISGSFSTNDSILWFYFKPVDSTNQIISTSYALGMPIPHVHRLTLYDSSLNLIEDRYLPDENAATEIRIDAASLKIGKRYLVRAARTPSHLNAGCNPTPSPTGVCNASMEWSFQLGVRDIKLFIPDDSGSEAPSMSHLYYENRGQVQDLNFIPRYDIKAYTDNSYPPVYLSDSAVSFVLANHNNKNLFHLDSIQRIDMIPTGASALTPKQLFKTGKNINAGYLNYFQGLVPNGITNINGYSRVVYKSIFTNIDMQVYSNDQGIKFYFVCNTGTTGNPSNIQLKFNGADSIHIPSDSGLDIYTRLGKISFTPGYAYEDSLGHIVPRTWKANFEKVSSNVVKFHTGTYNSNEPLIIRVDQGHPPSIQSTSSINWSTYYNSGNTIVAPGFTWQEGFHDVSTDATGNVYTTGYTCDQSFPVTAGAFRNFLVGPSDAIVIKFNSSDIRRWATYYGGSNYDIGNSIAADNSGNVYVTGATNSTDFPRINPGGGAYFQDTLNKSVSDIHDSDAFIVKFDSTGVPKWSTYYGGNHASESGNHLALDGHGNLYVVGGGVDSLTSSGFPLHTSSGAGTPYNNSTFGTGFILEFTTGGVSEWAARIGGNNGGLSSGTSLLGCATDTNGDFYVTGIATDTGYPGKSPGNVLTYHYNSIYPHYTYNLAVVNGGSYGYNAIATMFNKNNNIVWSTYYGGNSFEEGYSIAADNSGNAYITGESYSDSVYTGLSIQTKSLPAPAYNQHANGESHILAQGNAFIAEFLPSGALKWGTYFGDTQNIRGLAIAIDSKNILTISGTVFPITIKGDFQRPSPNAANAYDEDSILGYIGTPALCSGSGIGDNQDVFIASFVNSKYVWGTNYGPDWGAAVCDYKGQELYVVGNGGIGGTVHTTCYNPMPLNKGPVPGTSWFEPTSPGGGSPIIGEFSLSPVLIAGMDNPIDIYSGDMLVYPNPTTQGITMEIELKEKEDIEISLINILGETLLNKNLKNQVGIVKQQISLQGLPNGTYILRVIDKDKVFCKKVSKLQ